MAERGDWWKNIHYYRKQILKFVVLVVLVAGGGGFVGVAAAAFVPIFVALEHLAFPLQVLYISGGRALMDVHSPQIRGL